MDTITYELGNNLYINLTNRCSNDCEFCVRNGKTSYYGNELWLEKEPTAEEGGNNQRTTAGRGEVLKNGTFVQIRRIPLRV